MSKNRDALKFFQNFIYQMIDIGGENLPKSISTSLGAKLGKILKSRGITELQSGLKKIYNVLNAKTTIKHLDDNNLEVSLKYSKRFCPIGGKHNSERAKLIQKTICIPYTTAIMVSLDPDYNYSLEISNCILESNGRQCKYKLRLDKKRINNQNE
ncbi:MAG: hypothetical protein ACFE91_05070 [Promethearchaeota archaeon]